MIKAGDILDNRYEIESKIGQGGMSYVYRAKDLKLDRVVAIKMLKEECAEDEEFLKKFRNEAKSAANLTHPNIVAAYDAVDEGDLHYIVMELVEGITLKNYIARKGRLTNKETIGISLQAAEGIAAAHKKGIIHRDIKPQNLIISKDGKVKVADFGIARAVSQDTLNQAVVGSVHYIAPEQARSGQADERSDLYSLGICMYEMITGRVPFKGDNTVNVVMAHISEAMVPPSVYEPDIYPALNDIIIRATKKAPEDRYASAGELIADLKRCVSDPNGHFVRLFDIEDKKKEDQGPAAEKTATEGSQTGQTAQETGAGQGMSSGGDEAQQESGPGRDGSGETVHKGLKDLLGDTTMILKEGEFPEGDEEKYLERARRTQKLMRYGIYGVCGLLIVTLLIVILNAAGIIRPLRGNDEPELESSSLAEVSEQETETMLDITVEISPEQLMPSVLGKTVDDAAALLQNYGVSIDSSRTDFSDVYYEGLIIAQTPDPGDVVSKGGTVYVTVSLGTKLDHVLSGLQGLTPDEAVKRLSEVGVTVSGTRTELSNEVGAGLVAGYELQEDGSAASDTADTETTGGGSVELIISLGAENVEIAMPRVLGFTEEQALYILNQSGLKADQVTYESSDEYPEGQVCYQSVAEGAPVLTGSTIGLIVSAGASEFGSGLSDAFWYGSIDTVCQVGTANGPGDAMNQIMVYIRLKQRVNDSYVYTTLEEAKPVAQGSVIPVSFRNIKGASGIETGVIEVLNANTGETYSATEIGFAPLEG